MILGDKVVEERLLGRAPHWLKLQGPERPQGRFQGRGIEPKRSQDFLPVRGAPGRGVAMHLPRGRQFQAPSPLQLQEESPADHIAECTVGLLPPPGFAQPQRNLPPVGVGMFGDQLTDKFHFRRRDEPPPVAKISFHAWQRSRDKIRTHALALFFLNLPRSPAATPGPPAWRSGRPPP